MDRKLVCSREPNRNSGKVRGFVSNYYVFSRDCLRTFPLPAWHEAGSMDTHSPMSTHYLASLRIESLLRVVRRFVLAAVILPTFTVAPALLADTPRPLPALIMSPFRKAFGTGSRLRPRVFQSRRLR